MTFSGLIVDKAKWVGPAGATAAGKPITSLPGTRETEMRDRLRKAVEAPLGFPPLAQALVPDDHVTIPLLGAMSLLRPAAIQLVDYLVGQGLKAEQLTVLLELDASGAKSRFESQLQEAGLGEVRVVVHDPTDEQGTAYLAAAEDASPIVFSRLLSDADFVIPVLDAGRLLQAGEAELFPVFSDLATQVRMREPQKHGALQQLLQLATEARTHLGVLFEVLVMAPATGDLAEIVAGVRDETRPYAARAMQNAFGQELEHPVDLVVASPRGENEPYNWRDLLMTVKHLAPLVAVDGTLVIMGPFQLDATAPSELIDAGEWGHDWEQVSPSRAERESDEPTSAASAIADEASVNLDEALELMRIVVHGPGCEEAVDLFEALGIGVASSLAAVQRLIDHADRCLTLNDALQTRLRVKTNEEATE